jgi:hypothetical protein
MTLFFVCAATVVINIPFGFFRAGQRRYSWQWLLAVHLPVPLIIIMRLLFHLGWSAVPLLVACSLFGQMAGGWLKNLQHRETTVEE